MDRPTDAWFVNPKMERPPVTASSTGLMEGYPVRAEMTLVRPPDGWKWEQHVTMSTESEDLARNEMRCVIEWKLAPVTVADFG